MTYAFNGAGNRTLTFRGFDDSGTATADKTASISIVTGPALSSVKFSGTSVTKGQNVTVTAVTSNSVTKLSMYAGTSLARTWTSGYTDSGTSRTWNVTYAFNGTGNRTLTFRGFDENGKATADVTATILVLAAPVLNSVEFSGSSAAVNQDVAITAVTSTNVAKLSMYAGTYLARTWTSGYTDSGTTRTWNVTYAFNGAGNRTMTFRGFDDNGTATADQNATITVTQN